MVQHHCLTQWFMQPRWFSHMFYSGRPFAHCWLWSRIHCPCSCMGKQSNVVYHIPSSFGLVYAGETRWELKMRIPACVDYFDLEPPANTPGVLTHPSHIGYHHISPLSCSYCWWLLVSAVSCVSKVEEGFWFQVQYYRELTLTAYFLSNVSPYAIIIKYAAGKLRIVFSWMLVEEGETGMYVRIERRL